MNQAAASPVTGSGQLRRRVGRLVRTLRGMVLIAVLLFVVFEVGIRQAPPDGMTVTYTYSFGSYIHFGTPLYYTASADQQTINDYYAAFNRSPVHLLVPQPIINGCFNDDASSVVFTWHGIPVESWTYESCAEYIENAGGISDYYILAYHDSPDIIMPLPPPLAG